MPSASALEEVEQPCIRCGDCATVCPEQLNPQRLLLQLRDGRLHDAEREGALDCTECGRCDSVCPSRIPLVQRYRETRQAIVEVRAREYAAMAARDRYRARQDRLSRDEQAREERHAEQNANAASADAVAAAIARAQARRAARNERKP
jgi:electron transport complex protein RnfC